MSEVAEDLEPQTDASTSSEPEDRFADDTSVDTSVVEAVPDPVEVEAETEEVAEDPESEVESSPAGEEDPDAKTDHPQPGDIEYTEAVQTRMDDLTTNWRDTQRALESANLEVDKLRKQLAEVPEQHEPLKTLADFDHDDAKYQEYRMQEGERRSAAAARKAVLEAKDEQAREESALKISKAETEYAEKHEDYFTVTRDPNLRISTPMLDAVAESEIREDVLFHLGKNPDKAMSMYGLPDSVAGFRMGLLAAELKAEQVKAAKPKVVSKAPPPPPKIKTGDAGLEKGYHEKMTDKQFAKQRAKEIANR